MMEDETIPSSPTKTLPLSPNELSELTKRMNNYSMWYALKDRTDEAANDDSKWRTLIATLMWPFTSLLSDIAPTQTEHFMTFPNVFAAEDFADNLDDNPLKQWKKAIQNGIDNSGWTDLFTLLVQHQRVPKRPRSSDIELQTPKKIHTESLHPQPNVSPPRLNKEQMTTRMATAFEPFKQYLEYLAQGNLDGYLDSNSRNAKVPVDGVRLSTDPNLLLHGLGKNVDMNTIKQLFVCDTVHLFNTSGSGKTRLTLDGLCHNWGFYFSCQRKLDSASSGSGDFEEAITVIQGLSTWNPGTGPERLSQNATAADRVFAMLLCARIFVLKQFLDCIQHPADVSAARRRWVFLQIMPPCLEIHTTTDVFVEVFSSLRAAHSEEMRDYIKSMMLDFVAAKKKHFPERLFIVIDEAQEAARRLENSFPSTTIPSETRSALHELYKYIEGTGISYGTIISGTGLFKEIVEVPIAAISAKKMGKSYHPIIFTGTGVFIDAESQANYVNKFLSLSDTNVSDQRLLQRIQHWFAGRYHLTASLIELLLYSENPPRHRILTAFVKYLTGFTITDAIDLEDGEGPIPQDLIKAMNRYRLLIQVNRLFENENVELIQALVNALMRWVIKSQPSQIEDHMQVMISRGVGHMAVVAGPTPISKLNYLVRVAEPLTILSVSTIFEQQPRKRWITNAICAAPDKSSFIYEEMITLLLMENFGGKFTRLGDIFQFAAKSSLWLREVTLVSLTRMADGVMSSCEASWSTGSSDRFAFKAQSPADVLEFLNDPNGKPFLLPDNHMSPDVICFLQDKETQEVILLILQSKTKRNLDTKTWLEPVCSVKPKCFYTIVSAETRKQYAPLTYPNVPDDVIHLLEDVLGREESPTVVEGYHSKLRSSTKNKQEPASQLERQTPRYIYIIASSDDEQHCLEVESQGNLALLKSKVVNEYVGSAGDITKMDSASVH